MFRIEQAAQMGQTKALIELEKRRLLAPDVPSGTSGAPPRTQNAKARCTKWYKWHSSGQSGPASGDQSYAPVPSASHWEALTAASLGDRR